MTHISRKFGVVFCAVLCYVLDVFGLLYFLVIYFALLKLDFYESFCY